MSDEKQDSYDDGFRDGVQRSEKTEVADRAFLLHAFNNFGEWKFRQFMSVYLNGGTS